LSEGPNIGSSENLKEVILRDATSGLHFVFPAFLCPSGLHDTEASYIEALIYMCAV
jgi:hypothetical protein